MKKRGPWRTEWTTPAALALLRVVAGILFLQHGGQKLFGWFGGTGGTVHVMSQPWLAGVLEVFGGAAIAVGLFTRPVAFLLSGLLAVAYLIAHQPYGTWPIQNFGEPAVLYSFIFLIFAAQGAGRFSLDGVLGRARRAGPALARTAPIKARR